MIIKVSVHNEATLNDAIFEDRRFLVFKKGKDKRKNAVLLLEKVIDLIASSGLVEVETDKNGKVK